MRVIFFVVVEATYGITVRIIMIVIKSLSYSLRIVFEHELRDLWFDWQIQPLIKINAYLKMLIGTDALMIS